MAPKTKNVQYYEAIGRRKEASARVRLYIVSKGTSVKVQDQDIPKGKMYLNSKPIETTFPHQYQRNVYEKPLVLTDSLDRFSISIKTVGGGQVSQLEAIGHGIARSLCAVDEGYRSVLKEEGLLTRDSRTRERRKAGTGGKARRKKQSPKR